MTTSEAIRIESEDFESFLDKAIEISKIDDLSSEETKNQYIETLEKCLPFVEGNNEKYLCLQFNMNLCQKSLKGLKVAIYAYEIKLLGKWDPDHIKKGITGSEEAIICVSNVLTKMGHTVHVYADPPMYSSYKLDYSNPKFFDYRHYAKFQTKYDICLSWRRVNFDVCKQRADYVIFWPHDFFRNQFPVKDVDLISYLSRSHKEAFLLSNPPMKDKTFVIAGNGVDFSYFDKLNIKKMKIPFKCIYASNYTRGLEPLLDIWPEIIKKYPQATLDVYYGRETWGGWKPEKMNQIVDKMKKLPGVSEKGKIGHEELAKAFAESTFWLYPYVGGSETFCITAIKAQRAGCIPVVVKKDALLETIHASAFSIPDYERTAYLNKVLEAFEKVNMINTSMFVEFAKVYTWDRTVNFWIQKYNTYISKK